MNRVVVTGMGMVTGLGNDWINFKQALKEKRSSIKRMDDWDVYDRLNTRLGGPVTNFEIPSHYSRKQIRSMGRCALFATRASELALIDAGLLDDPILQSGAVGVAYGSSTGSTDAALDFAGMLLNNGMKNVTATTYIRMMGHTCPVNVGVFFGLKGRVITTSSACTSGSQGIGSAYEAIKYGHQTAMVAGGAEELCPTEAAVFDTLYATSVANDTPECTPRPFDKNRDGLVIGEGAGTLILEELEHAIARGAHIYAEVVGYGTNSDGKHVTQPNPDTMEVAMQLSLKDSALEPNAIGYINAHGTATDRGDVAESHATQRLFGNKILFSSLKGNIGHTLGACGAIEAWATINMLNDNAYAPTLNLQDLDPECAELDYVTNDFREKNCDYVMSNNFAFGGINTSLIFRRWSE